MSANTTAMDALKDLPPLYSRLFETCVEPDTLQPGLQPTARTRAGISFLQRVLDAHDCTDLDEHTLMIDRVELNQGKVCTVAEFGSAELLGLSLNEDRHCGAENGIVGSEIEVFSARKRRWRCAFVAGVCEDRHLLIFYDGVMERVSLVNKTWRLMA